MIEVVALSPDNELPVAQRLRELVLAEWPDLAASANDRVRIFAGAHMFVEVDLIVELSLARARPVAPVRLRDGSTAPAAEVTCGVLAIEVKQQSRERFRIEGTEIYPIYGRDASQRSVAKQISDATVAVRTFLKRYTNEQVFVHGLGWLTDVPERDLEPMPGYIAGREATWSSLLQAAATRSRVLFEEPSQAYRNGVSALGTALVNRRRIAPRDRAAVDRLTNASLAQGQFDTVTGALGTRQIRLAGRAGSGKSTLIALLAQYVASVRQERLLVLTYHHALCNEIERLIRSFVGNDALVDRHVRVATLVDFLADACSELGADVPREAGRIDYANVAAGFEGFIAAMPAAQRRAEAAVLEEIEPERFGFDYVCVDEAQDCLDCERDVLRLLYPPQRIVLADGLDQLVRGQTPCDWTSRIGRDARLNVELAQSLRMARNVASFATAAAEAMGVTGWRITPHPDLSGGRILISTRRYDDAMVRGLVTSLEDAKLPRKDLLVCVPPGEIVTDETHRDSQIGVALRSLGYGVWNGCDEVVRRTEVAALDEIRVVQYDSMRGLEGWCTLLVGLDTFYRHRLSHPNLRAGDTAEPEAVAKRWLLMALTRAAQTLAITLDDPGSDVAAWLRTAAAALPDGVVEWRGH